MTELRVPINVLGIYGHSAYAEPAKQDVEFDVNQVPMMFFDVVPLVTGRAFVAMFVDGQPLKDHQEQIMNVSVGGSGSVVERRAYDFWIPQKFRTVGKHTVTIRVGVFDTFKVWGLFSSQRVVWVDSKTFGLTFTGIKAQD